MGAVAAALVLVGGLVIYSDIPYSPSPAGGGSVSSTSSQGANASASVASTNQVSWAVVRTNTTVYYGLACTPLGVLQLSCPTMDKASHSPSLSGVDVVRYGGQEVYDVNFSAIINGQRLVYAVWFTNDTVVCVSPALDGYALCPVHPPYLSMGIADPSASTTNPSHGLRLYLTLSNTTQGVNVTVGVRNTLGETNNVTSASDWATYPNSLIGICDNQVAAFAVYRGGYSAGNFTSGSPLAIDNVHGAAACPEVPPSVVYSFAPESGVASASARFASGPSSMNVTLSFAVSGYYTCSPGDFSFRPDNASGLWSCPQGSTYDFNPLAPGTYTVVALDQWGDVAVLHFEVYP